MAIGHVVTMGFGTGTMAGQISEVVMMGYSSGGGSNTGGFTVAQDVFVPTAAQDRFISTVAQDAFSSAAEQDKAGV